MTRSTTIAADRSIVHALINDFREWRTWSPWEDLDPDLQRSYSGPPAGVGSHYDWAGNKKAGRGSMEITVSTPESVEALVEFKSPFESTMNAVFTLREAGRSTAVDWTMTGERSVLMQLGGKLFFDRAIAKDFENGLARLKQAAEQPA